MDNYKLTYAIIKTAVENGVRYIQDNPKRGVRNLLDLGEYFAEGRFQKYFFELAHEILNNEDSYYYNIIENMVRTTNHKTIRDYGINIGFNSLTYGANIIRKNEEKYGCSIPWVIIFDFETTFKVHLLEKEISKLILDSKKFGIYSYMILLDKNVEMLDEVIGVIENNKDCAFMIFVHPEIINEDISKKLGIFTNLCINILIETNTNNISEFVVKKAMLLKKQKCFYGAYMNYDETNFWNVINNAAQNTNSMATNFAILIKSPICMQDSAQRAYDYIYKSRVKINTPVCLMDFYGDIDKINGIISNRSCLLVIDSIGQVNFSSPNGKKTKYNIIDSSIEKILSVDIK